MASATAVSTGGVETHAPCQVARGSAKTALVMENATEQVEDATALVAGRVLVVTSQTVLVPRIALEKEIVSLRNRFQCVVTVITNGLEKIAISSATTEER